MLTDIEALIEPFLGEKMIQEIVSVLLRRGLSESFCLQVVMEVWERVSRASRADLDRRWEGDSGIESSEDGETEEWEDDWGSGVGV